MSALFIALSAAAWECWGSVPGYEGLRIFKARFPRGAKGSMVERQNGQWCNDRKNGVTAETVLAGLGQRLKVLSKS